MLFKWDYGTAPMNGAAVTLMLGTIAVGDVYQVSERVWRASCDLPDSGNHGGKWVGDFPSSGVAKSSLELCCTHWISKTGMWQL